LKSRGTWSGNNIYGTVNNQRDIDLLKERGLWTGNNLYGTVNNKRNSTEGNLNHNN
jgi:hypothetical protein